MREEHCPGALPGVGQDLGENRGDLAPKRGVRPSITTGGAAAPQEARGAGLGWGFGSLWGGIWGRERGNLGQGRGGSVEHDMLGLGGAGIFSGALQ